jgi:ABC-type bacteriocin/lantibiotic exporter with double-glycine peptidase domain
MEMERAAQDAGIRDRIGQLPEQYDTVIQPGTSDLSGGERQRLALARVLASPASVLLLDEPFSNLDSEKEREIISTLREFYLNRIVLIITHRRDYIAPTDKVFYLGMDRSSVEDRMATAGLNSYAALSSAARRSFSPHPGTGEPTVAGTRRSNAPPQASPNC